MKHPEFLKVGQRLVFREGRTKAVGNVTKIVPHAPAGTTTQGHKGKPIKLTRNEQRNKGLTTQANNEANGTTVITTGQGSTKVNGGPGGTAAGSQAAAKVEAAEK